MKSKVITNEQLGAQSTQRLRPFGHNALKYRISLAHSFHSTAASNYRIEKEKHAKWWCSAIMPNGPMPSHRTQAEH